MKWQLVLWVGLVGALAAVPLVSHSDALLAQLFMILLYSAIAQSWNMLGGYAGQVNLGHAAFFGIGALVARTLLVSGQPIALALLAGGIAAAAASQLIGLPAFRLRGVYFAIGTLAVSELIRILTMNNFADVSSLPVREVATYSMVPRYYAALLVAVAVSAALAWLSRSRLGLGIMAVREDESAAQASGVNALGHKLFALACSALFAGLAGGLYAYQQTSYYHYAAFSPLWTFEALLVVYIGGAGSIGGPLLGAVFYVLGRGWLASKLPEIAPQLQDGGHLYVFGALFILVVLTWPGGLIQLVTWRPRRFRRRPAADERKTTGRTA